MTYNALRKHFPTVVVRKGEIRDDAFIATFLGMVFKVLPRAGSDD